MTWTCFFFMGQLWIGSKWGPSFFDSFLKVSRFDKHFINHRSLIPAVNQRLIRFGSYLNVTKHELTKVQQKAFALSGYNPQDFCQFKASVNHTVADKFPPEFCFRITKAYKVTKTTPLSQQEVVYLSLDRPGNIYTDFGCPIYFSDWKPPQ